MIRLLMLALLIFFAYKLWRMIKSLPPGGGSNPPPEKSPRGEDMVQDPHCGTYVPRGDAVVASYKGTRHYFCSNECRDAFRGRR